MNVEVIHGNDFGVGSGGMKMKKALSLCLAVFMLLAALPAGLADDLAPKAEAYAVGDTIQFGTYPQSEVTDGDTLASLNAICTPWVSYGYYSGSGVSWSDGQMQSSDYMQYRDAVLDGVRYRAVRFSAYRPADTGDPATAGYSRQDDNGYELNTVYWFRFDPITWRVLDPEAGLVLSEIALDAQAFNNFDLFVRNGPKGSDHYGDEALTHLSNDYAKSDIRRWLNSDFSDLAFTPEQKSGILTTHLETTSDYYPQYNSEDTDDELFLLAYEDASNESYGFSRNTHNSATRLTTPSDYAKVQGVAVSESDGTCFWRLRSPSNNGNSTDSVSAYSGIISGYERTSSINMGIRPACRLSELKSDVTQNTAGVVEHVRAEAVRENEEPATCAKEGSYDEAVYCTLCGALVSRTPKTIEKLAHTPVTVEGTPATCTEAGLSDGSKCAECGETLTAQEVIPAKGHTEEILPARAATCTQTGLTEGVKCSVCGEVLVAQQTIPATGEHVDEDGDGYCDHGCGTKTSEPSEDSGVCEYCGKDHSKSFWQAIICFFTRIFTALFSAVC